MGLPNTSYRCIPTAHAPAGHIDKGVIGPIPLPLTQLLVLLILVTHARPHAFPSARFILRDLPMASKWHQM